MLVRELHVEPGDLCARGLYRGWTSGWAADRRTASRRMERAAARPRLRAGNSARQKAPRHHLILFATAFAVGRTTSPWRPCMVARRGAANSILPVLVLYGYRAVRRI